MRQFKVMLNGSKEYGKVYTQALATVMRTMDERANQIEVIVRDAEEIEMLSKILKQANLRIDKLEEALSQAIPLLASQGDVKVARELKHVLTCGD